MLFPPKGNAPASALEISRNDTSLTTCALNNVCDCERGGVQDFTKLFQAIITARHLEAIIGILLLLPANAATALLFVAGDDEVLAGASEFTDTATVVVIDVHDVVFVVVIGIVIVVVAAAATAAAVVVVGRKGTAARCQRSPSNELGSVLMPIAMMMMLLMMMMTMMMLMNMMMMMAMACWFGGFVCA